MIRREINYGLFIAKGFRNRYNIIDKSIDVIISKMLGYVEKILKYSANMFCEDFVKNDMVVGTCVFNLSQIGELAN